jgi:hypothetical protein
MILHPAQPHSTRTISALMIAAFAGVALWLFVPWASLGTGSGDGNAALPPSLKVDGEVTYEATGNVVTRIVVPLAIRGDEPLTLPAAGALHAETSLAETAAASVPATYSLAWLGGNGDGVINPGERVIMTVELPENTSVHPDSPLRLVVRPGDSVRLVIEDVLN